MSYTLEDFKELLEGVRLPTPADLSRETTLVSLGIGSDKAIEDRLADPNFVDESPSEYPLISFESALEDFFGMDLGPDEWEDWKTVGDVLETVNNQPE